MCIRDSSYTGPDDDNKHCRNVDPSKLKFVFICLTDPHTVSYTHLDVYKRQENGQTEKTEEVKLVKT